MPGRYVEEVKETFRPRQKLQGGADAEKGSAFAIEAAEAKARDEKTAKLKAARLAKEAAEPKAEAPAPKPKPARKR